MNKFAGPSISNEGNISFKNDPWGERTSFLISPDGEIYHYDSDSGSHGQALMAIEAEGMTIHEMPEDWIEEYETHKGLGQQAFYRAVEGWAVGLVNDEEITIMADDLSPDQVYTLSGMVGGMDFKTVNIELEGMGEMKSFPKKEFLSLIGQEVHAKVVAEEAIRWLDGIQTQASGKKDPDKIKKRRKKHRNKYRSTVPYYGHWWVGITNPESVVDHGEGHSGGGITENSGGGDFGGGGGSLVANQLKVAAEISSQPIPGQKNKFIFVDGQEFWWVVDGFMGGTPTHSEALSQLINEDLIENEDPDNFVCGGVNLSQERMETAGRFLQPGEYEIYLRENNDYSRQEREYYGIDYTLQQYDQNYEFNEAPPELVPYIEKYGLKPKRASIVAADASAQAQQRLEQYGVQNVPTGGEYDRFLYVEGQFWFWDSSSYANRQYGIDPMHNTVLTNLNLAGWINLDLMESEEEYAYGYYDVAGLKWTGPQSFDWMGADPTPEVVEQVKIIAPDAVKIYLAFTVDPDLMRQGKTIYLKEEPTVASIREAVFVEAEMSMGSLRCFWCRQSAEDVDITVDKYYLEKEASVDNLVPCCHECQKDRGEKTPEEMFQENNVFPSV